MLHESQLNIRLLKGIGINHFYNLPEIIHYFGFTHLPLSCGRNISTPDHTLFNLIIHPTSNKSGREWPLAHFGRLIQKLDPGKFRIFITGEYKEDEPFIDWQKHLPPSVINLVGKQSIDDLILLISQCDCLIASGTGPLHIASAMGLSTIGLFPPIRPLHTGRWGAIGLHACNVSLSGKCNKCKHNPRDCSCMKEITVEEIEQKLAAIYLEKPVDNSVKALSAYQKFQEETAIRSSNLYNNDGFHQTEC